MFISPFHLVFAVLVAVLLLIAYLLVVMKRQRRKGAELQLQYQAQHEQTMAQLANLKSMVDANQNSISQLPKIMENQTQLISDQQSLKGAVDLMHSELGQLQNAMQLMESANSEDKMYTRAKKLIELGADVEEVITECGISRSEADLLLSLASKI